MAFTMFSTNSAPKAEEVAGKSLLETGNKTSDEHDDDSGVVSGDVPRTLEGVLMTRKGQATGHGSVRWRKRFVRLTYSDGGSLSVFEDGDPHKSSRLIIYVGNDLPWFARDVHNSPATFAIEIPTDSQAALEWKSRAFHVEDEMSVGVEVSLGVESPRSDIASVGPSIADDATSVAGEELNGEMSSARRKGKPVRLYFKCRKGGNEKALWLEAFQLLHRYESKTLKTNGIRGAIANGVRVIRPHAGRARKRTHSVEQFSPAGGIVHPEDDESAEQGHLDETSANGLKARINQICYGKPMKKNEQREYKVIPAYAYPHRWMSIKELYEEMMLPSTCFHDLRDPARSAEEIGLLKVEVLQCVGLPRLDRASDTDGVVYLVCGPCAFSTDVIPDRTNPMWLRKTQRACIFPIYHGYARLYAGVFDDDGEKAKDDFAGRVVIDIARLRHSSTYDVTLPLRLSTHTYNRRKRGALRLRFTLSLQSEKAMLLSYLPTKFKVVTPANSKPNLSTTIACADPKAFRNIALTVHGQDLPGHFTFSKIKAAIRETSLIIRFILETIIQEIRDTKQWKNPTISAFIFCAWMHCIYVAKFGLVPGYLGVYIMLQLVRTYAIFVVERTSYEGFVPPTFEEMFDALIKPRSGRSIESLEMQRRTGSTFYGSSGSFRRGPIHTKTHEPGGRWLFRMLGFLPWDGSLWDERNLHLEFPFANGDLYEKITLEECLADTRPIGEEEEGHVDDEDEEDTEFEETDSLMGVNSLDHPERQRRVSKLSPRAWAGGKFDNSGGSEEDSSDEIDVDSLVAIAQADSALNSSSNPSSTTALVEPMRKEQDLDWRGPGKTGKGEKLTESLQRISFKLHSLTLHSFHDYAYDIKNPEAVYFHEAKNIESDREHKKMRKKKKLNKKLDRLLGVNEFSTVHPITNRVATLAEPMIGSGYGFLCFFRAFYNVATWQDPYLTFLLFIGIAIATIGVFLVPWRAVLFIAGMLFVGPQNWLIRVLRERGTIPPRKPREHKDEVPVVPEQQIVFHGHKRLGGATNPKAPSDVDLREVHHIVVPYNRMMYQRFYDWPPEQSYANVVPVDHQVPLLEHGLSSTSVVSPSLSSARKLNPEETKNARGVRGLGARFRKWRGGKNNKGGGGGMDEHLIMARLSEELISKESLDEADAPATPATPNAPIKLAAPDTPTSITTSPAKPF